MAERIVIQKKLEEAIAVMKPGSAFTAADFSYLNDPDSVNKALSRIAESGKIRRAMQGVYDIPMKITLLEEDCDPLIPQVAYAIARKNGWSIRQSGHTSATAWQRTMSSALRRSRSRPSNPERSPASIRRALL